MKYRYIDAQKADMPVRRACALFGVSQSGYYAWVNRPASAHQREDMVLLVHIRASFYESNETYGSPRMVHELREKGFDVGRRRVARLMRENGLKARIKRRFRRTTDSRHEYPVTDNVLDRAFTATAPNQKWGVDISYVWTAEGWLYLAVVMDFYARRIVGWAVSDRLKKELVLEALNKAITLRRPPPGLIHHSDRGSQYCSYAYRERLKDVKVISSMSGRGNCYDNAVVESFFKTIKSELIWRTPWQTRNQATREMGKYIDGFYNPKRRHSAIGYTSPIQYEMIKK